MQITVEKHYAQQKVKQQTEARATTRVCKKKL